MYKTLISLLLLPFLWLAAPVAAETTAADILVYRVEPRDDARGYLSRVMVSDGMLRMEEIGDGAAPGYTLYDRALRLILGVDPESRSVMLIGPATETPSDREVDYRVESEALEAAPGVAGKIPVEHRYVVNGEPCFTLIAVAGEMAGAMRALGEMSAALAERHRRVMGSANAGEDCKMPLDAFAPGDEFSRGLLLSFVGSNEVRQLVEFQRGVEVDGARFEEPPGYQRLQMP